MPLIPPFRLVAATLVLAPTAVLAHPGDHADGGFLTGLRHVLGAPDHLALLAAGAIVVAVIIWLRKGRAE